MTNVQRAWVMLQWCGVYNIGISRLCDHRGVGGWSTMKVEVKWPLDYGA